MSKALTVQPAQFYVYRGENDAFEVKIFAECSYYPGSGEGNDPESEGEEYEVHAICVDRAVGPYATGEAIQLTPDEMAKLKEACAMEYHTLTYARH